MNAETVYTATVTKYFVSDGQCRGVYVTFELDGEIKEGLVLTSELGLSTKSQKKFSNKPSQDHLQIGKTLPVTIIRSTDNRYFDLKVVNSV